ncbi:response regulator [Acinetobacter baumannii 1465485]|nr:response regulator [Acinetobacter baumannii 1465485]
MITVLVVDDHELVRTGICRMLEDHADVEVIGQAESGEEAIAIVRQQHPQVVLLDVNMPGIGGVETTRRLLQTAPETKVIAVSGLAEEPYPSLLLKAGAKGYILKARQLPKWFVQLIRSCKAVNILVQILPNNSRAHIYPTLNNPLLIRYRNGKCKLQ